MWRKTISGLKRIEADYIHSNIYEGLYITDIEQYILSISGIAQNLGTSLSVVDLNERTLQTLIGVSNSNIANTLILHGTSISNNVSSINLLGVSTTNLQATDNYLQSQIDSIVISGISAGNLDVLYGVSIVTIDNYARTNFSQFGITLSTHTTDISLINTDLDTLFTYTTNYGTTLATHETRLNNYGTTISTLGTTTTTLDQHHNLLGISLGVSFGDIQGDINYVYDTLDLAKADEADLDSLTDVVTGINTALGVFDAAQTAYNVANELWKVAQDANNTYQSLQLDGVDDRLDDHDAQFELETGTTFPNIASSIGVLDTFKNNMLGTTLPNIQFTIQCISTNPEIIQCNSNNII